MRGLTLWQPMAWAIAERHKPVENRPWALPSKFLGKRFAVHAGKKYDEAWAHMIRSAFGLEVPSREDITLGAVVAVAEFAACVDDRDQISTMPSYLVERVGSPENVHRWFSGPYGFLLADVRPLTEPVPCRGFQGLWTLPPAIEIAVCERIPSSVSPPPNHPGVDLSLSESHDPRAPILAANSRPFRPVQGELFTPPKDDDIPY